MAGTDSSPTIQLGYWSGLRSLGSNLRYQLAYTKTEYEFISYDGDKVEEWFNVKPQLNIFPYLHICNINRQSWQSRTSTYFVKLPCFRLTGMDFPNLPYLVVQTGDGPKLQFSETQAIHQYFAAKFAPALLGDSPEETAKLHEMWGIPEEVKNKSLLTCYGSGATKETVLSACTPGFEKLCSYVEKKLALSGSSFLMGENIKWVDFFLELLERFNWLLENQHGEKYPPLQKYRLQMAALPGVQAQLAKELPHTFNASIAPVNGKGFPI